MRACDVRWWSILRDVNRAISDVERGDEGDEMPDD